MRLFESAHTANRALANLASCSGPGRLFLLSASQVLKPLGRADEQGMSMIMQLADSLEETNSVVFAKQFLPDSFAIVEGRAGP